MTPTNENLTNKVHSYKFIDLTGKRFGKLVVKEYAGTHKRESMWKCQCDCGEICYTVSSKLKKGKKKSCGCSRNELAAESNTKHGLAGTRIYGIYRNMIYRCEFPNAACYENYGGRGIRVCDQWRNDFIKFYEWSMNNGYEDHLTIDRIDNDKDYEPSNCRWATRMQQQNNRRDNHFLTYNGETHTITEWGRIVGLSDSLIRGRIKCGWSVERALMTKPIFYKKKVVKE